MHHQMHVLDASVLCSHRLCATSSEFLRSCNVGLRTASNEPCWRRDSPCPVLKRFSSTQEATSCHGGNGCTLGVPRVSLIISQNENVETSTFYMYTALKSYLLITVYDSHSRTLLSVIVTGTHRSIFKYKHRCLNPMF